MWAGVDQVEPSSRHVILEFASRTSLRSSISSVMIFDLPKRASSIKLRSPEENFLNYFCVVRSLKTSSSNAIHIIRTTTAALVASLYS
ncbi:hypothetical protein Trydic_g5445 [Trypoxylus dichotomus]